MPRPKLPRRKISVSVTLEEAVKKHVKKVGDGNMSKGIELVVKQLIECQRELSDCKKESKTADKV